jgi:hypothetical protein
MEEKGLKRSRLWKKTNMNTNSGLFFTGMAGYLVSLSLSVLIYETGRSGEEQ